MDAELKQKWIEALRSGDYKQGTGALRDDEDNFCCLGVLCDIIEPEGWEDPPSYLDVYSYHYGRDEEAHQMTASLTTMMIDDIGLPSWLNRNVMAMNDRGSTFEEIANYLQFHL